MARGYSEEADRILNYLEHGIFDALGKHYLRSFIFAVYLDSKDPNNIVEAYTFNFRYHKIPESDSTVPIMTLGEDLQRLKVGNQEDPVTEAAKKGRTPTLRDVKKSVKTLLKTLIHAMSQMDVLPKRRYATFKIFYTDATPSNYEPPYFQSGDAEKDRWYMMTHNLDEIPDKWSIGKVDAGHHSVELNITSIATYLPSVEHQEAAFSGTTESHLASHTLTPLQEAAIRVQQIEQQEKDAEMRNLVWSTEADVAGLDMDAEGEDDPDYVQQLDGSFLRVSDSHVPFPIGVRNELGVIEAIAIPKTMGEAVYSGAPMSVPAHLSDLNNQGTAAATDYDETQTFVFDVPGSPLPPSDPSPGFTPTPDTPHEYQSSVVSPEPDEDETHLLAKMSLTDTIDPQENFLTEDDISEPVIQSARSTRSKNLRPSKDIKKPNEQIVATAQASTDEDRGLACECSVLIEDECCFCEGGCARWFHIWCMGYHSTQDKRIPARFVCIDCRLRADVSWELIKSDVYSCLMSKYRALALFRRAIKIAERMGVLTSVTFAKQLGTEFAQSRQLLRRLEDEGFIQEHVEDIDKLGIINTRPKKKGAIKHTKQRRHNMQKNQYRFSKVILNTPKYRDYFDPSLQTENRLLGIGQMVAKYKSRPMHPVKENKVNVFAEPGTDVVVTPQTQEDMYMAVETQPRATSTRPNKRPSTDEQIENTGVKKKKKISVATAVDLAE